MLCLVLRETVERSIAAATKVSEAKAAKRTAVELFFISNRNERRLYEGVLENNYNEESVGGVGSTVIRIGYIRIVEVQSEGRLTVHGKAREGTLVCTQARHTGMIIRRPRSWSSEGWLDGWRAGLGADGIRKIEAGSDHDHPDHGGRRHTVFNEAKILLQCMQHCHREQQSLIETAAHTLIHAPRRTGTARRVDQQVIQWKRR